MNKISEILNKIFIFEKEPQRIGLTQFKPAESRTEPVGPSLKKKDVKLSDLMRRAG